MKKVLFTIARYEDQRQDYTCAEVMWYDRTAPNGDRISTIQKDLLEVCD